MTIPKGVAPWPDEHQEWLLKAALLNGDEARSAWKQWIESWNEEAFLDHGSFRLLPLLYRNLARLGVGDPRMMKLKGIYRHAWYKNVNLFHRSRQFLNLFHDDGIPTLLLKGPVLALQYYKDLGARPMADIDVLIPRNRATDGIALLHTAGWKADYEEYIEYNLRYGRSMMFYNEEGVEFDLHWYPFFESLGQGNDRDFWDHAIPLNFMEIQTHALGSADNLLHVILHGLKWNPEPPIRWIADALVMLRSEEYPIDWNRFAQQVRKYKVVLQIREALDYLLCHFKAPIPARVMDDLEMIPITFAERLIYRYDQKNPDMIPEGFRGKIHLLLVEYLRQSDKKGFFRQMFGFLQFIRFRTKGKNRIIIVWYYLTRRIRYKHSRS